MCVIHDIDTRVWYYFSLCTYYIGVHFRGNQNVRLLTTHNTILIPTRAGMLYISNAYTQPK